MFMSRSQCLLTKHIVCAVKVSLYQIFKYLKDIHSLSKKPFSTDDHAPSHWWTYLEYSMVDTISIGATRIP